MKLEYMFQAPPLYLAWFIPHFSSPRPTSLFLISLTGWRHVLSASGWIPISILKHVRSDCPENLPCACHAQHPTPQHAPFFFLSHPPFSSGRSVDEILSVSIFWYTFLKSWPPPPPLPLAVVFSPYLREAGSSADRFCPTCAEIPLSLTDLHFCVFRSAPTSLLRPGHAVLVSFASFIPLPVPNFFLRPFPDFCFHCSTHSFVFFFNGMPVLSPPILLFYAHDRDLEGTFCRRTFFLVLTLFFSPPPKKRTVFRIDHVPLVISLSDLFSLFIAFVLRL